jgi:hypothetical protein
VTIQGTLEWFSERAGKATASRFKDVLAKTKTGYSSSRKNYAAQLVVERLTGTVEDSYQSAAMQRGTELEPLARMAWEARTGLIAEEVGFIPHPTLEQVGGSPDGVIGADGLLEIKAPNTATHIEALLNGMDPGHVAQIQGLLWITGRRWCEFVSFDNRMPEGLQLYVQRVPRDDAYITALEVEIKAFLAEVAATVERLQGLLKRAA